MLLRSITKHIKDQNWFAVALDFVIVVFGVFVGLQVQQWVIENQRQSNEHQYLIRLHDEVELLIKSREHYDQSRPRDSAYLQEAVNILSSEVTDAKLEKIHCDAIAASSHTTIPPADLPTIRELLSSARLDQILSSEIRQAILSYSQHVTRARDLITITAEHNVDLSRIYSFLISVHYATAANVQDGIWLNPVCDAAAMRKDKAFMNALSINSYFYKIYADRAVLPVSQQLMALHNILDRTLSINHPKVGSQR